MAAVPETPMGTLCAIDPFLGVQKAGFPWAHIEGHYSLKALSGKGFHAFVPMAAVVPMAKTTAMGSKTKKGF